MDLIIFSLMIFIGLIGSMIEILSGRVRIEFKEKRITKRTRIIPLCFLLLMLSGCAHTRLILQTAIAETEQLQRAGFDHRISGCCGCGFNYDGR